MAIKNAPENLSNSSSESENSYENFNTVESKLQQIIKKSLKFNSPFSSPRTTSRSLTSSPCLSNEQSPERAEYSPKKLSPFKTQQIQSDFGELVLNEAQMESPRTPTFTGIINVKFE